MLLRFGLRTSVLNYLKGSERTNLQLTFVFGGKYFLYFWKEILKGLETAFTHTAVEFVFFLLILRF